MKAEKLYGILLEKWIFKTLFSKHALYCIYIPTTPNMKQLSKMLPILLYYSKFAKHLHTFYQRVMFSTVEQPQMLFDSRLSLQVKL